MVGNIGGHVVGLRLDHRQGRQRTGAVIFIELRGPLQKAAVQVKYVPGISLASGRAAQKQGHLAIGHGLFGQIIIDNQPMHAVIAEIFSHGATGKRCQELHRRRIGSGCSDDNGIFERPVFFQSFHKLGNCRPFLTNSNVNAIQFLAFIIAFVDRLLVQDRIESNRGLCRFDGRQ